MHADARKDPNVCAAQYTGSWRHFNRPKTAMASVTAGLMWPPEKTKKTAH